MNKIIFALLILPLTITAQRYDPYRTNAEYDIYDAICDNIIFGTDHPSNNKCVFLFRYHLYEFNESPNDLGVFVRFFFECIQRKYKEFYPDDYGYNTIYLQHLEDEVKFTFQTFNDQTIAIAKSMGDSNYEIVVDPAKWNRARIAEKVWIMFHELAHEFFSTRHGQGGGMMFPISAGDNISLNRLWNGWDAMGYWIISNKRSQLKRLHKEIVFK